MHSWYSFKVSQAASTPVVVSLCRLGAREREAFATAGHLLPAGERERAGRFARVVDRAHFVAAHVLARHALREAGMPAPEVFPVNAHGKPLLPGVDAVFNITHTEGLVGCAVARGCEVGLDAEARRRDLEWSKLARLVLAPSERALVEALPDEANETFLRFWTLKEAMVKAAGLGLVQPLPDFVVNLDPPALLRSAPALGDAARWSLATPDISAAHCLALAIRSASPDEPERPLAWREINALDLLAREAPVD